MNKKFGIGNYFDDMNPEFMDAFEVVVLRQEVEEKARVKAEADSKEQQRREEIKAAGRGTPERDYPDNAQAVVIACEREDNSDTLYRLLCRLDRSHNQATMYKLFVGFRKLGEFDSILIAKQFANESGITGVFNLIGTNGYDDSWYVFEKHDDKITDSIVSIKDHSVMSHEVADSGKSS